MSQLIYYFIRFEKSRTGNIRWRFVYKFYSSIAFVRSKFQIAVSIIFIYLFRCLLHFVSSLSSNVIIVFFSDEKSNYMPICVAWISVLGFSQNWWLLPFLVVSYFKCNQWQQHGITVLVLWSASARDHTNQNHIFELIGVIANWNNFFNRFSSNETLFEYRKLFKSKSNQIIKHYDDEFND